MATTLLAGDVHGDIDFIETIFMRAEWAKADRIVQLGDLGYLWPGGKSAMEKVIVLSVHKSGIPFYFIDGNHDNHSEIDHDATDFVEVGTNFFYIPRGHAWEWEGERWIAMGGAYSVDVYRRTAGVSWWPEETPSWPQINQGVKQGHADIVISHDAPWGHTVPGLHADAKMKHRPSRWTRKGLAAILDSATPRRWYHGHHHERYVDVLEHTGGKCRIEGLDCNFNSARATTTYETGQGEDDGLAKS